MRSASRHSPCVAVVEDDGALRQAIESLLRSDGHRIEGYASAEAFLSSAARQECLVLDSRLPRMSGIELLLELRARGNQVPVIVITAHEGEEGSQRELALRASAYAFFRKPFDDVAFLGAVRKALRAVSPPARQTKVQ